MDNTTKAAKCPDCGKYHLIASIEYFDARRDVREDFAELMVDGFEIIETTTQDAKDNFGFCSGEKQEPEQLLMFN